MAYLGSMRQRSDMKPCISLIPRSVTGRRGTYPTRPPRNSDKQRIWAAQNSHYQVVLLQGTGWTWIATRPSDSCPSTAAFSPRGPSDTYPRQSPHRSTDADRHRFDRDGALLNIGLRNIFPSR